MAPRKKGAPAESLCQSKQKLLATEADGMLLDVLSVGPYFLQNQTGSGPNAGTVALCSAFTIKILRDFEACLIESPGPRIPLRLIGR